MADTFTCGDCGKPFSLPESVLKRYPGWKPSQCMPCRKGVASAEARTTDAVLATHASGPQTGVFTDGGCDPNPGPGGWGAVKVVDGAIVEERHGHEPGTTNNQMELRALIEAFQMIEPDERITIYSDSQYCVRTINEWAPGWQEKGWKRSKDARPLKNLDLIRELFELSKSRPNATLEWVRGHAGARWNEYADALAQRWKSPLPTSPDTSV